MKNLNETKICKKCLVEKPLTDFHQRKDGRLGSRAYCKMCMRKNSLDRYYNKGGKEKQKIRSQKYNLQKYGLSIEDYNKILLEQDGKCKICLSVDSHRTETSYNLFVDHCHVTGKVRGLLCHHCNAGLGHFKDSRDTLNKAIEYLNETNTGH